ncbi:DUF885 domain-containing protein [Pseudomarimonas salicorniae]|uniref:DUF885 domain-containing protein n=1 Tax=Pseudomarimonas salicorniae TaxID=2933270 RepID=A0ABT0GLG3_9GAMM|nr:DUF885 domain-containing protein [Lysobacter sp. CAU 1642]MCK7595383.1 DUF885 domain-containing protein [Lysobacter sp. CAU 1642]
MWRWLRWPVRLMALLLVVAAGLVWHQWNFKPWSLDLFYQRAFLQYAIDDPQMLSSMRILPPWLDWYSDELTDVSLERQDALREKLKDDLATLRSYDREALSEDEKLSYDVLEYFLAIQAEGEPFRFHNYPANQLFGFQSGLPTFMATQHPVRSQGDADDYNARLDQFDTFFAQQMEGVRLRVEKGIVPPSFVVEKVLAETRNFVATKPEDNILYTALAEKLDAIEPRVEAGQRQRILATTRQRIEQVVYPAMQTLVDYYAQLLPSARPNNGVWDLPQGSEFYAYAVRQHTTTDMTPDEVHELGLAEVARIEAEMDAILQGEGLVEGTIGERVDQIASRPDQLYPDTEEGRQQILADYQAMIDEIDAGIAPYFGKRPRAGVIVERVPVFREKTAPGAYYNSPAFDGSRPGVFYANLRSVKEIPRFGMRTLAYHEGIPGHHFQKALQQEATGVPFFRKVLGFTAFAEGWALYAERLAWEMGFQDEPLNNLGRLQAEMFRAVRLVVDSGMHHKRWTREQAIDYMREKTGMPPTDVTAEIERYLVNPGQALAYKVGMNTILRLREEARAALGERFSLKDFHDVVLTGGDMPLTLLERRVKRWVASQG